MAKRTDPGDVLDMSGVQQQVNHVEDEQRLHPVVGEAFPGFGERDVAETAWMPEEAAIFRVMHRRRVLRPAGFGKRREIVCARALELEGLRWIE